MRRIEVDIRRLGMPLRRWRRAAGPASASQDRCRGTTAPSEAADPAGSPEGSFAKIPSASSSAAWAVAVRPRSSSKTSGFALLRHDRRAGGEGIRQRHKTELPGIEQQHVCGEASQVLHQQRDLEQQMGLGPCHATAGAAVTGVWVESKPRSRVWSPPVQRQTRRAVAGRADPSGLRPRRRKTPSRLSASSRISAAKPPAHNGNRTRHGLLHMGIAG